MSSTAPNMGLKYAWDLGTYFKAEMDANLKKLDRFYMPVLSATIGTPPGSPTNGDRYIIPNTSAVGEWIGNETKVATYVAGAWEYDVPVDGMRLRDLETDEMLTYDSGAGDSSDGAWITDDLATIKTNLRGIALVNMSNSDYTMTLEQAKCGALIVLNSGFGRNTLTAPTTSDTHHPGLYSIITSFNTAGFYFKAETFGGTGTYIDAVVGEIALSRPTIISPTGLIALCGMQHAHATSRGFVNAGGVNYSSDRAIRGKTIILDAASINFVITQNTDPGNPTDVNAVWYVIADYSGCAIVAENTAQNVVFPAGPYLEVGQRYCVMRDGITDTYRVFKG